MTGNETFGIVPEVSFFVCAPTRGKDVEEMELAITIALFALGVVLIVKGGDWFVDSAAWIAEVTGIPKFIIGATIVSLATTMPEMIVSVMAAVEGKVDMAVGNAVGSVTANTGLILAISVLAIPAAVDRLHFDRKAILLILSVVALLILSALGQVNVYAGIILVVLFVLYLADNLYSAKAMGGGEERRQREKGELGKKLLFFALGAAGIVIGARLLVDNGSALAQIMGVPENIIGLTFVAIGTSLPELVTTVTAIMKRQASLSVGNIVGANIIDISLILPVCAAVYGGTLPVNAQTYQLDLPVCLGVSLIALLPTLITGRFRRWQGAALLVGYAAYLIVMML